AVPERHRATKTQRKGEQLVTSVTECPGGRGNLAYALLFRGAVPAQQLRKILRERRARQHHVTSHFVRLLLQIALYVGEKSNNRSAFFQLGFELGNQRERLGVGVVQIEDDERRLLIAVLIHAVEQIFFGLDEFNLHVQLARGLLNFR